MFATGRRVRKLIASWNCAYLDDFLEYTPFMIKLIFPFSLEKHLAIIELSLKGNDLKTITGVLINKLINKL